MKVTEYLTSNIKGFQALTKQIGEGLKVALPWIDNTYTVVKAIRESSGVTPCILTSPTEYLSLLPSYELGNYSFFMLEDPMVIDSNTAKVRGLSAKASLVVWFDMRKAYQTDELFNSEAVKLSVLEALHSIRIPNSRFEVSQVWEKPENIFKGFTTSLSKQQFLMAPYYGFRFEGTLTFKQPCTT